MAEDMHEIVCPICGESFKDARGLHGHLRFKEGLQGEELKRVYEDAKRRRRERINGSQGKYGGNTLDYLMGLVDRIVQSRRDRDRAREALQYIEDCAPLQYPMMGKERRAEANTWQRIKQGFEQEEQKAAQELQEAERELDEAAKAQSYE